MVHWMQLWSATLRRCIARTLATVPCLERAVAIFEPDCFPARSMKDPQGVPSIPSVSSTSPRPKNGRVAVREGGGTATQNERLQELKDFMLDQDKRGRRAPKMPFKSGWELANMFGVTERTIRRDIKTLNGRDDLKIDFITDREGYGLLEAVTSLPVEEFSRGDYFSLWMSVQAFQAWGGLPYQKRLPVLIRKLQSSSQAVSPEDLKRMRKCITFKAGGFQAPLNAEIFETVIHALMAQQELRFEYHGLEARRAGAKKAAKGGSEEPAILAGAPEWRRVQPLHVICWDYAWYLFAYDYARKDIRTFAIGRMLNAEDTGKHFKPARPFHLKAELAKSFGIRRGGRAEHVYLRFCPEAAPLVIERLWHPSQEFVLRPDRSLEMTMKVAVCPELIRWVRGWGPEVEILAPSTLNTIIVNGARQIVESAR